MVQSMELKLKYIDKLINKVKNHQKPFLALKTIKLILKSTFEQKVGSGSKHPEIETLRDAIEHLHAKHSLLDVIFENMKHYCNEIRTLMQDPEALANKHKVSQNDLHTVALYDEFAHAEQISERLEFISFYTKASASIKLSADQLSTMWDLLVLNSCFDSDKKALYQWLRDLCDKF